MAPHRKRKIGLSRIDACLDFFSQLGYSRAYVRKTVRSLLQVYGGEESWPFIEEGPYQVVLDTILEAEEKKNALGLNEDLLNQPCAAVMNEDYGAGPSVPEESIGWRDKCMLNSEEVDTGAYLDGENPKIEPTIPLTEAITNIPIRESISPSPFPRRKPCYGWISDGEDEAVDMKPLKKKSRWDVGPNDVDITQ